MAGKGKSGPRSQMTKWEQKENLVLIQGWKRKGLTDEEVAQNMGISPRTLYRWTEKSLQIRQSLKYGKEQANYIVENKLFERAVNGNTTAMIFWLKNNYRDKYSDSQLTDDEIGLIKERKRKTKAEADIAESKAKLASQSSDVVGDKVDKLFSKLVDELDYTDED